VALAKKNTTFKIVPNRNHTNELAMNVYDKASAEDIHAGLRVASKKLLGRDLLPKGLLPATPKQGERSESAA